MTIPTTVLLKTEESAHALAADVVSATLELQTVAAQHRTVRATQDKLAGELNDLTDFLSAQRHRGRTDWSPQVWGSIYDRLSTTDLIDPGVLAVQSERELEALANPPLPATGTPDDPIMVLMDGRLYATVLDDQGRQRFVQNKVLTQLYDIARLNQVAGLDALRRMTDNGHFSPADFRGFVAQVLHLTIEEFLDLCPDASMTNPAPPREDEGLFPVV